MLIACEIGIPYVIAKIEVKIPHRSDVVMQKSITILDILFSF